jgi:hypothetical protein
MALAEDPKPGWSYFKYKYPDITPTDIPTIIERINRLEATVCKLTARANTTDEVLDILMQKKMNQVESSLKWKKKETPNLDHPTRTPSKLTELKDNKYRHMAIIKKSIAPNRTKCPNPKKIGYPPKLRGSISRSRLLYSYLALLPTIANC